MGNREDLLAGAKACLYEKGYARTTARDIAAAAGTSLAAIGYHFRTKEALLNEAVIEAMGEWGDAVGQALAGEEPGATPERRFASAWDRVIESFGTQRQLWVTQLDLISQLDRLPELREQLTRAQQDARLGLASIFFPPARQSRPGPSNEDSQSNRDGQSDPSNEDGRSGPDGSPDRLDGDAGATALRVGALLQVILGGILLQWLVGPDTAPSGPDIAEALRIVAARLDPVPAADARPPLRNGKRTR